MESTSGSAGRYDRRDATGCPAAGASWDKMERKAEDAKQRKERNAKDCKGKKGKERKGKEGKESKRMQWKGMEWNGMEWNGWNGMEKSSIASSGGAPLLPRPGPPHAAATGQPVDGSGQSTFWTLHFSPLWSVWGRPSCANAIHSNDMSLQAPPGSLRGHPVSPKGPLRDPKGPLKGTRCLQRDP